MNFTETSQKMKDIFVVIHKSVVLLELMYVSERYTQKESGKVTCCLVYEKDSSETVFFKNLIVVMTNGSALIS